MNLLLINHYAGTPALGMEYRPYYLAREWVRAGHRVQIVAAAYSHVRALQPAVGSAAVDEVVDGIAYRWLPAPAYAGNGIGRVRNIWAFLRRLWADAPRLATAFRPDAVIASSTYPLDIWVARRIARLAGALLVHEVHDLWPLSPIELSGMSPWHPFALLCQAAENTACRDADVVVSMLPKVHAHMAAHGLDLRRLHVVPNGIVPDDWAGAGEPLRADVADALAAARAGGAVVVGYAGSMGEPNALDTLLDAAALLQGGSAGGADAADDAARERAANEARDAARDAAAVGSGAAVAGAGAARDPADAVRPPAVMAAAAPLRFVLVGSGHLQAHLAARIAAERLGASVALLPPIAKAQIPALLAAVDIAYIGWQRVPIYRFGIAPNKLMDYMMAGCAVLHSVDAGNDPVAEAGCGLTVPPQDAAAVADGLRRLAALPAGARRAMGERGRAFVLAEHAYPVLAQRFIDALRR